LLREIIEKHYGVEGKAAEEPFLLKLEKVVTALGKAKEGNCPYREGCPIKNLGIEPSAITCALCQIHTQLQRTTDLNPQPIPNKLNTTQLRTGNPHSSDKLIKDRVSSLTRSWCVTVK